MADSYVTSGATMKCSCGDKTARLTVYPDRTVFLTEKPMANISDHVSIYNIAPFGKCRTTSYPPTGSATAANNGSLTPMPCVPGTISEWLQGKGDYIIKGKPALLKSSYCKCQWGGIITITDDGQTDTGDADLNMVASQSEEEWAAEELKKEGLTPEDILDGIQTALDLAGFFPGLGAIPDLLNASIYAFRGDMVNAGLSVAAAVPGIGDAAAGAKLIGKGVKAAKTAKKAEKAGNVVKKVGKSSDNVTSMNAFKSAKRQDTINNSPNVIQGDFNKVGSTTGGTSKGRTASVSRIESIERKEIKIANGKNETVYVKRTNPITNSADGLEPIKPVNTPTNTGSSTNFGAGGNGAYTPKTQTKTGSDGNVFSEGTLNKNSHTKSVDEKDWKAEDEIAKARAKRKALEEKGDKPGLGL